MTTQVNPKEQTVKDLLETIYESNLDKCQVNNPKWWLNTMEQVKEEKIQNGQWPDLLEAIDKLLLKWNKFYKSWAVNSSAILIKEMAKVPGGTLAMLFPLDLMSSFLDLWNSYGAMVNQELPACSDTLSNTTTCTSSMTAPIQTEPADAPSAGTSSLSGLFAQQENITDLFGNLQQPTGTMSSFISTVQNKEHVKYGIEEPVGEFRLTVRLLFAISRVFTNCTG